MVVDRDVVSAINWRLVSGVFDGRLLDAYIHFFPEFSSFNFTYPLHHYQLFPWMIYY